MKRQILILAIIFCGGSAAQGRPACSAPQNLEFEVTDQIERTERSFTQGLEHYKGSFFESTGAYRGPTRLNLLHKDGSQKTLSERTQRGTFGEGLTVLSEKIYQATWQDHKMFVFDTGGAHIKTIDLAYEAWGLANDGRNLILTDGSAMMRFLDPSDLSLVREFEIRYQDSPLHHVNELEWVNGKIFGNIYYSNWIVRIDPSTGCVDGLLDATPIYKLLLAEELSYLETDDNFVLNGIAYLREKEEFYLTGKNWKFIFSIKLKSNLP